MSVAVIGSIALDTIDTPSGRRERLLGGSATYFAAAARFFTAVRMIGVVGDDFNAQDEGALHGLGVDTTLVERRRGRTYAWHGRYGDDYANASTIARDVGVFEDYRPRLPTPFADLTALFLGAIAPPLQSHVLDAWPDVPVTALDTRESWIEEERPALTALASRVDLLFLNVYELQALTGRGDPDEAARSLVEVGSRCLVVKRGADGAVAYTRDGRISVPAYRTSVVDPTGAGDAFAGGFIGICLASPKRDGATLRTALRYGAALASLALEGFGIDSLARATRDEVDARAAGLELQG